MRHIRYWRLGLLSVAPLVSLTGLLALSLVNPDTSKKPPPFPLSLFAQATADDYIDDETCKACHPAPHAGFQASPHMPYSSNPRDPRDKQGCQSCHGPGGIHVAHLEKEEEILKFVISFTKSKPMESATACLRCHNDTMTLAHWRRSGHAQAGVSCSGCHKIHKETDLNKPHAKTIGGIKSAQPPPFTATASSSKLLKADELTMCGECHQREVGQFRQNFHHPVPEGRLLCSDCHELHPRRKALKQAGAQTRQRSVSDMCVTCHPEIAGPFVFEHDPVAGTTGDGCLDCHQPHGSHNPKLLNMFSRGTCNQCHTDKANNHYPGRSCWQSGCHVAVHGSNTDRLLLRH